MRTGRRRAEPTSTPGLEVGAVDGFVSGSDGGAQALGERRRYRGPYRFQPRPPPRGPRGVDASRDPGGVGPQTPPPKTTRRHGFGARGPRNSEPCSSTPRKVKNRRRTRGGYGSPGPASVLGLGTLTDLEFSLWGRFDG